MSVKHYPITIAILLLLLQNIPASGRNWESRLMIHSGLFNFSGSSARASTYLEVGTNDVAPSWDDNRTAANPYGSKSGLCYGLGVNEKRCSKKNLLCGAELSLEILRSRIELREQRSYKYWPAGYVTERKTPIEGRSNSNFMVLNLQPFIGYRTKPAKNWSIDIEAGVDVAACITSTETRRVTDGPQAGHYWSFSTTKRYDFRPRLQVTGNYRGVGLFAGYSFGLTNYARNQYYYPETITECYSRLFRFGLAVKL